MAFAAGDPGIERGQCGRERHGFAQVAAGVRIMPMQTTCRVLGGKRCRIGSYAADIGEAKQGRQPVTIGQGFGEMFAGMEEQYRN